MRATRSPAGMRTARLKIPLTLRPLTGAATFYAKWTENPTEPYPPAEGNARGEITMEVGEIRTQNGSKGSGHAWTSSDLSIVKITDDDDEREVKFKGVSAGTAYLTHTYTNKGNQVTEYWKVTVSPAAPKTYTVRFSANGGSGSAPESVTVKEGETITLPGQGNLSGYGKVFVGWSNGSDATGSDNFTSQFVYPSGSYYTVTENVTLYATWASQGVTGTFFIRLDGRIPYEPGGYDSSDYSSGITIKNVISVAKFTSGESAVLANLRATPTADQIKKVWPTYDYRTQYIQWYVIKHEGDGWHIDGVLLERDLINLNYDANCVDPTGNVPMGDQYNVNDTVTVERGTVARRGYTFGSWNTASDGSGTSYEPGDTFTITEATTLYAQWIPNGNTKYIVEHYLETAAGSGEYTSAAREQKSGSTDSEVSATPNTYEGYEYNAAKSRATGIIAADGSLVLELYYDKLPTYGVTYEYATPGLPGAVADTIPSDDGMYLAGASVTAKSPSQTSVTVEENGVVIGTWSFNGWDEASKNMAEGGITFTGTWTYTETGKARVTHVYSGELPDAVMATLPTDSNEYYIGAPVTPTAPTSTTVTITNADGIVTDTYTFGGWDKQSDTMVSGGVTFTGTWTHTKTAQAGVQYVYSTPGLPGEVTATRPTDANLYYIGTAVNAQNPSSTSVDIVKNGVTVGTWTFGGWDKPSDTMVSGGITFTGTWTYEAATEYGVSYQYVAAEGTLPDAISTSGGASRCPTARLTLLTRP